MRIAVLTDLNGKAVYLVPTMQVGFSQIVVPVESPFNTTRAPFYATVVTGAAGNGVPGGNKVLVREVATEVRREFDRAMNENPVDAGSWTPVAFMRATDEEGKQASKEWEEAQDNQRLQAAAREFFGPAAAAAVQ